MAASTVSASRVAATSWVRMYSAPCQAAKISAASVAGPARVMSLPVSARRKDLRDGDTRTGTPKVSFSSPIPASTASDGAGVLPRK